MESIVRNVRDIPADERQALEHVIGQRLRQNQQVIIKVVNVDLAVPAGEPRQALPAGALPDWCKVYDGLSDEEIEGIEAVILDRDHGSRESAERPMQPALLDTDILSEFLKQKNPRVLQEAAAYLALHGRFAILGLGDGRGNLPTFETFATISAPLLIERPSHPAPLSAQP